MGLLLGGLLVQAGAQVRARQGAPEAVVFLARQSRPAETEGTVRAVWAQLSDVQTDLRVQRVARLPPDLPAQVALARRVGRSQHSRAVIWYGAAGRRVHLLLLGPPGDRILTREVGQAGTEGRYEAVAVILRSAILARRAGRVVGRPAPREPRRPAPRESRRPAPRPSGRRQRPRAVPRRPSLGSLESAHRPRPEVRRLALDLAWGASLHSRQALLATGARFGLWVRLPRGFRVGAAAWLELPIEVTGSVAHVQFWRVPVTAAGSYLWQSGRLVLGGNLELGLLVQSSRLSDVDPDYVAATSGPDLAFLVEPCLLVGVVLRQGLLLTLGVGFRGVVPARRYVARRSEEGRDGEEVLLSAWPVQPLVRLGIDVGLY